MSIPPVVRQLELWAATASGTDVAVAALAVSIGLIAAHLALATLLYAVALARRAPRLTDRLDAVTPPVCRRLARRLVAAALVAGTWAPTASAVASVPPPGLRVPTATREAPALDLPTVGPGPRGARDVPTPVVAPPSAVSPAPAAVVTVRPGEHLWSIAARHLADARGVPVGDLSVGDVAGYWRTVVRLNAPRLPSRDPDLIHPGDEVRLPPVR